MSVVSNNRIALAILKAKRDPNTTVADLVRLYGVTQAEAIRVFSDLGRG